MGIIITVALITAVSALGDESETAGMTNDIMRLLKASGAVSYAHKTPYAEGIESVYIGFGKDDKPVAGLAVRNTKTYKQAMAIVVVTQVDGSYKIAAAEIPDVGTFHGKSQTLTKDALKDITGKVFKNEAEARGLVDSVTGATQYLKALYVSYALMASKVIVELSATPDWPRTTIQP